MSLEKIEDLIDEGRFFQFSADMLLVDRSQKWHCALINNSAYALYIYKLELYWDGGEVTAINKREALLSLYMGDEEIDTPESKPLYWPVEPDISLDQFRYVVDNSDSRFGVTKDIDPDDRSMYPITFGKTTMKPDVILLPMTQLYLGAHTKCQNPGNLSIVCKGFVYDKEENRESSLEITQ